MRRFFVAAADLATGQLLELDPGGARHAHVLRLERGDEVTVVDPGGHAWRTRIVRRDRRATVVEVLAPLDVPDLESHLRITVAQGLARGARMEEVIRHGCELGVAAFAPLLCSRSTRRSGNVERWRTIARDAARQCGRTVVPVVHDVIPVAEFVASRAGGVRLLLAPPGPEIRPLPAVISELEPEITLLVGPEGGFTPAERSSALAAGYLPASMGPRTLRTETAALAAVAALQAALGDWE